MNIMRILGYIIIFVAFVGSNIPAYPPGGTIEAICLHELEKMPKRDSYSPNEVLNAMKKAAYAASGRLNSHIIPEPMIPGLIMIFGVALVDFGARRKVAREPKPDNSSGST